MKTRLICYLTIVAVLCAIAGAVPAWAQTATISGKVTDNDKPQPGLQVIYKSTNTGRVVKAKTDKNGEFYAIGVPVDVYNVTVVDSSGKTLYNHDNLLVGQSGDDSNNILNIDFTKGTTAKTPNGANVGTSMASRTNVFAGEGGTSGTASKAGKSSEGATATKEEMEKYKAEKAKVENINALIGQYQAAMNTKDWQATIAPLQGMIAADPTHWEYFQALGNSQLNLADYENAVQSYDKGIQVAQGYVSGATPKDPKNANTDPAKAKAGMGQMLANQGNAYLKLKKTNEAVAAYTKAAELDPNPGVAYFNLCATEYNIGNMEAAVAVCEKAIQADPNKAEAYFIKGSAMYGNGKLDANNKYVVPPGTTEAFKKYLELAPDGGHAADVKAMLDALGVPIETTYKTRKK